ncbi:MAG TPA: hypothetical protein VFT55_02640, partial [Planctomycetota bacterium]|nr:hypothetical protein [Planctomycetota bacterium]
MTVGDWFVLLGYAALATTAGSLLLRRFGFQDPLVANWGACLLCGQMLLTLAMLTTAFVPWRLPQLGPTVIAGTALLALVELVVTRRRGPAPGAARRAAAEVGLLLLPLLLFPNLVFVVQHMPPIAWDARSIWFLHGRFLTLAEGIDPALFADPRISWSHPDYPLHLSAQSAWIAWLRGAWSDVATRSFLLVTFAATFRLALAVFAAPGRPAWLA